jgi:hypothetical protein
VRTRPRPHERLGLADRPCSRPKSAHGLSDALENSASFAFQSTPRGLNQLSTINL